MLTFDRVEFEKSLSLSVKKKVPIESKWEIVKLNQLVTIVRGASPRPIRDYITEDVDGVHWIKIGDVKPQSKYITDTKEKITKEGAEKSRHVEKGDFILSNSMSFGRPYIVDIDGCIHDGWLLMSNFNKNLNKDYFYNILADKIVQDQFIDAASGGTSVDNLNIEKVSHTQIPLPPLDIQKKIVSEIEVLEAKENNAKEEIEKGKEIIINLFKQAESKADKILRLSDENVFQVSIGKRVLKNEFVENGKIPVYSANVIEPFGKIDKLLIEDFSKPSVLWGIDGDWMVSHLPKDNPFYPTDHCGVLRVKDNSINEKYLAFILEKEGKAFEFSRTKRASIDKIQGIKIAVPSLSEQQKIVLEIEKNEERIKKIEKKLAEIPKQKEVILKKYLE